MSANVPKPQAEHARKVLFHAGFIADPYTTYRHFLNGGDRIHLLDVGLGVWGIFEHAECLAMLRDPRLSAKRAGGLLLTLPEERRVEFAELIRMLSLWMLFLDAPEHSRLRKLLNKGFSPAAAETLRPHIEAAVKSMLDEIGGHSEVDLMQELAHPLPVNVIATMLGIPKTMRSELSRWSDAIAKLLGNPRRTLEDAAAGQEAVLSLTEYFRETATARRKAKGDDLISLLLQIEEDGEVLSEEEVYAQCVMLLFGGHETTRNLIGNGIYTLLRHPAEAAKLRDDRALIRSGVEELLRYESPVQYTSRVVKEELELCGARLERGQLVFLVMGAANRDAKEFNQPDRLDLGRTKNSHLSFGAGTHFCIGNQIARLTAQMALLGMTERFPEMKLATEAPDWTPLPQLRGLKTLPVALV